MTAAALLLALIVAGSGPALSTPGQDTDMLLESARSAFDAGMPEEALACYLEVLKGDPENRTALQMTGYILYKAIRYEEAKQYFQRSLDAHGDAYHPLLNMGNIALQQFQPVQARDFYLRALRLEPDDVTCKDNLQLAQNRIQSAQRLLSQYTRTSLAFWFCVAVGSGLIIWILILESRSGFPRLT